MRQLLNPVLNIAQLNFEGSGESKVNVKQLWEQENLLVNALDYVNWEDSNCDFQFILCKQCGFVGCEPQGWISLRRTESLALIIPAFESIREASKYLETEYFPPTYLWQDKAYFIDKKLYQEQLVTNFKFPLWENIPELLSWEAAKVFQFEAPHQIIGKLLSNPTLNSDLIVASSEGSYLEQVPQLNLLLEKLFNSTEPITIRPKTEQEKIISFYLDVAGFPEWQALVSNHDRYKLYLSPNYTIETI